MTSTSQNPKLQVFTCNACSITLGSSAEQRAHMREDWHVYNVKRRVASLPALDKETYETTVGKSTAVPAEPIETDQPTKSAEPVQEDSDFSDEEIDPLRCLFCPTTSDSIDLSLTHMFSEHGLFIPENNHVTDMETFISFLSTVVSEHNECLFCGTSSSSTEGIQQHMRDKGHCMLNLDREPELLDFWDFADYESDTDGEEHIKKIANASSWEQRIHRPLKVSASEVQLPSGRTVASRAEGIRSRPDLISKRRAAIKKAQRKAITNESHTDADTTAGTAPDESNAEDTKPPVNDKRVAVRGERGLIGVPEQQRKALMVTEKKMQRREQVAKSASSWVTQRAANSQKHFRSAGPGNLSAADWKMLKYG